MRLKVASRTPEPVLLLIMFLVVAHLLLRLTLGYGNRTPDLFVVALLIGAREINQGNNSALGFLLGILEDGFSAMSFGANTVALSILGLVSSRIRDTFVGDSPVFLVAYFFLGKCLRDLTYWIAVGADIRGPFLSTFLPDAFLGATYVCLAGVVLTGASAIKSGRK